MSATERAGEAMENLDKLTAADCGDVLRAVEKRQAEVKARLAEVAPPPAVPAVPPGSPGSNLDFAGPAYRKALASGSPEDLAAVVAERRTLEAEEAQLRYRRDALRRARKAAEEREARAEAPRKAKALLKALPGVLDDVDAALGALADALDRREETLRELEAARALLEDPPFYSPELLRRVWATDNRRTGLSAHAARKLVSTSPEPLSISARSVFDQSLQVETRYIKDVAAKLGPVGSGLLDRIRKKVAAAVGWAGDVDARSVNEARARLVAAGDLEAAEDESKIAEVAKGRRGRKAPLIA